MVNFHAIKRCELIDHTHGAVSHYPDAARTLIAKGVTVTFCVQDDGATLKVFLSKEHDGTETGQRPPA